MLADPQSITYNAVAVSLARTQENGFAKYYGENSNRRFTLSIAHTIPAAGSFGESHVAKLLTDYYDVSGVYIGSQGAWMVQRSFNRAQVSLDQEYTTRALRDFLTNAAITAIAGRQS